jgi:putative SOS response-associated peptidase YedK
MCGRVVQHRELSGYARELGINLSGQVPNAPPHYNGAPSQDLLVLRRDPKTGEGRLGLLRWGLIPHWAKDKKIAWRLINARCETVGKTAAFKDAYRQRRCLIPVDGFYEWKKIGKVKQPFLIAMKSGDPFTLAGLWENWKEPATREWVRSFTIVTTDANTLVAGLHDRMPVIIAPEDRDRWLSPEGKPDDLLRPFPPELMTMWPVSTRVNSPKNEDRELIEPVELETDGLPIGSPAIPRANEGGAEPSDSQ